MQIEVKNLSHKYSEGMPFETQALTDVSFTISEGEFVALIGHTGSGKSTLAEHVAGLVPAQSGEVLIDGENVNKSREARRKTGMVFQYPEYQLFEETVLADVCFGPKNMGLSEEECVKRAKRALVSVGIDPELAGPKSPFALSGGEKRRVAIAGVLAMNPKLLILDEPTAGLDPEGREEILSLILRVKKEYGVTIIFVSHDMDAVAAMADRVLVMDAGALVLQGTPREVFAQGPLLCSIGLELPSAAGLCGKLRARGLPIADDAVPLTAEEAVELIIKALK